MYFLPDVPAHVDFFGFVVEVEVSAGAVHVYPIGAAGLVVAAHVHVTQSGNSGVVEALDHVAGVQAHELVVMPCVLRKLAQPYNAADAHVHTLWACMKMTVSGRSL